MCLFFRWGCAGFLWCNDKVYSWRGRLKISRWGFCIPSLFLLGATLKIYTKNGLNLILSLRNVDSTSRESLKFKNLDDLFFPVNSARLLLRLPMVCDLWFVTLWLSNLTQWSPQKTEILCSLIPASPVNNFKKPFSLKYTLWLMIMHDRFLFLLLPARTFSPNRNTLSYIISKVILHTNAPERIGNN